MKLKRVKGGNGKRWKKGHSCVSNPGNMLYREMAKTNFFQKLDGESGLTVEALAEHTAALAAGPKLHADPEDDRSVGRTFNTFATNFTTCTIPAFEKFFKGFSIDSELQTRMLAIHAAAQEYIQEANLTESSTSYMCALMVSLEGVKDSEDDVAATLALLAKVIRKVSKEVLKAKFGEYSKLLDEIFISFSNTRNSKLLLNIIGCLSVLLRAQEEVQWTYPYTLNLFHKIISFTTHEDADVRRAAQYNASAVLKGSSFMIVEEKYNDDYYREQSESLELEEEEEEGATAVSKPVEHFHPAAVSCGKFVITNLKLATENMNGKATLYLLIFLQQIIKCLPEKMLEQCCARVLSVMPIGDNVVNNRALKVFGVLFTPETGKGSTSALTLETNEALINALTSSGDAKHSLRLVPGMNNAELSITWMDVVASGIVHLSKLNEPSGIERFTSWIEQLSTFWKSEYESVHEKVWHAIDYLFDECIKPLKEKVSSYTQLLLTAFHQVENRLSLQYESAWPYVFSSLSPFFWVLGPHVASEMMLCLRNLTTMVDTPNLKGNRQLENAIGSAINGMGPEEVMKIVPLQITGDIKEDENHFWILPLLKKYVKNSRLCFFESYFVHLASKCFILLDGLKKRGKLDSLLGKTYQLIELQLWALLPSFADGAVDIERALSIQSFAKLICDHIKFRDDTRIDVMAGLRNMLNSSTESDKLAFYAKNYLPALFNVYLMKPRDKAPAGSKEGTVDPGQRLATFTTIQAYLRIVPTAKLFEFFDLILNRYENEESDVFRRKALLNLARSFLPYLDHPSLSTIYLKAATDVTSKKSDVQKTAYRIIEDILSADSDNCKLFIKERIEDVFELLFVSAASVVSNAKAPRLKCLLKVLSHLPPDMPKEKSDALLKQVVLEAVNCCSRQNSAPARKTAFALLSEVGKTVQTVMKFTYENTFHYCFSLLPPLIPPSDSTANTILALMALSYQYKDLVPSFNVQRTVEDISSLLASGDRNVVKSSLSFIRMAFALYPPPIMSDHVDVVVGRLIGIPDDGRRKFRMKIRDIIASLIRKFGADRIRALIPEEDPIHKMVTNIVKKDNRRRRLRKASEESEDTKDEKVEAPTSLDEILAEIDKDMENDDRGIREKRLKLKAKTRVGKKQTWIKENEDEIVDLLDLSSSQNITTKKPKMKQLRFDEGVPQTDEEKYGFRIDRKTNKFIITERGDEKREKNDDDEDVAFEDIPEVVQGEKKSKSQQMTKRKRTVSEDSNNSNQPSTKYEATGSGEGMDRRKKKFDYGAEFRSRKAGGDVVKKGGVLPYAYVQFSKEKLNRRKKAKYAGQFRTLIKGVKKGALKGAKMKKRRR